MPYTAGLHNKLAVIPYMFLFSCVIAPLYRCKNVQKDSIWYWCSCPQEGVEEPATTEMGIRSH